MERPDITIRTGRIADIPAMVGLLEQLFSLEEDFTFDPDRQRRGLLALFGAECGGAIWVAQTGRRVVGMCTLQVLVSTAEGGPVGLLEDLVVDREHRGRGIGRRLLQAACDGADERGLLRLQLLADRHNAAALDFYNHVGWGRTQLICLRRKQVDS